MQNTENSEKSEKSEKTETKEKDKKDKKESRTIDPINGIFTAQSTLFHKVNMLQERLEDILGLKESLEVWKRKTSYDIQYREGTEKKISDYMQSHTPEEVAKFLHDGLYEYYTRRIALGKALEKVGNIVPSSTGLKIIVPGGKPIDVECDIIGDIRKSIAELGDIHTLLANILKKTISPDAVDNKSLCDDEYLAALAGDCAMSPAGLFINAHKRFSAMVEEIESAKRQVAKLKERVASYSNTPEAQKDKAKLNELEESLQKLLSSPEAVADAKRLKALRALRRKHYPDGSDSTAAKKIRAQIKAQEKKIADRENGSEVMAVKNLIKEQRKKIMAYRNSPEAKAAALLVDKRNAAIDTLKLRLASEAERFCKMRNEILRSVARATGELAHCRNLPDVVRDVFRRNPPSSAEDITAMNYKLAFKN